MDFDNVLSIASQNQGLSSLTKRYSLKTAPPKKDVKIKGVNSAAVQAFLKKQASEQKKRELKNQKAKEDLLARRVELKSDRKARAMASRTKDNFRGYNGVPVADKPKKRTTKSDAQLSGDACDDEDEYDHESEPERHAECVKAQSHAEPKKASRTSSAPMNFADLLKLAHTKQFEPVELRVVKKTEERLRTAEEIHEHQREQEVRSRKAAKPAKAGRDGGAPPSFRSPHASSAPAEKSRAGASRRAPGLQESGQRNHASTRAPESRRSPSVLHAKAAVRNGASLQSKPSPAKSSLHQRPGTSSDLTPRKLTAPGASGKPTQRPSASSQPVRRAGDLQKTGAWCGRAAAPAKAPHRPGSRRPPDTPPPPRPPCTVVSETLSAKNLASSSGAPHRPQASQGPRTVIGPTGHRILVKPPGPALPPITSAYKQKYEEEDDDSEMEDFIDDGGEDQNEISRHIREIFGYDRTRYKDESDYALKFMESSWREQQKEEARSLRLGIKEDEDEMRLEEEEMKRKLATRVKRKKI